jgi:hypothetical protein
MASLLITQLDKRLNIYSDKEKAFLDKIVKEIKEESNGKICGNCIYKQGVSCLCHLNFDGSTHIKIYKEDAIACKHYVEKS